MASGTGVRKDASFGGGSEGGLTLGALADGQPGGPHVDRQAAGIAA